MTSSCPAPPITSHRCKGLLHLLLHWFNGSRKRPLGTVSSGTARKWAHRSMTTIEPITFENIARFIDTRLRALRDAPSAFGSTYAGEQALTPQEWSARVARWDGKTAIGFLAMEADAAVGVAGAYLDSSDATSAQLVSMWTSPEARRRGVGRLLVEEILRWARARGARVIRLMVTSNNDTAEEFYRRLGFEPTGRSEPYPNDPALVENEMSRLL
jgi:ribosomal protein S18 acetylase RimI-like enzyme